MRDTPEQEVAHASAGPEAELMREATMTDLESARTLEREVKALQEIAEKETQAWRDSEREQKKAQAQRDSKREEKAARELAEREAQVRRDLVAQLMATEERAAREGKAWCD